MLIVVSALVSVFGQNLIVDIKECDGHKSGIYLTQKEEVNYGVVPMFLKITQRMGAYGLFHYKTKPLLAHYVKTKFENAIVAQVNEGDGFVDIDWMTFLRNELDTIRYKSNDEMEVTVSIVIVVGNKATMFGTYPFIPPEYSNTNIAKHRYSDRNRRFIIMKAGFEMTGKEEDSAQSKLEKVKDWKQAAKTIVDSAKITEENKDKVKGAIVIDLGPITLDRFIRRYVYDK